MDLDTNMSTVQLGKLSKNGQELTRQSNWLKNCQHFNWEWSMIQFPDLEVIPWA